MKFIYIAINKCANTSFKSLLKEYGHILIPHNNIVGRDKETNLHFIKNSNVWSQYYKFTVVRNPVNRFLSSINFLIFKKYIELDKDVIKKVVDVMFDTTQSYDFYYDEKHGIKRPDSKSCIKRVTLPITHNHYCLMKDNKLDIDYFIKIEDLENKMEELCQKIKINKKDMPHLNKSEYVVKDLSENYLETIKKYYELDAKIFNYNI
jgi:hypothetical protein